MEKRAMRLNRLSASEQIFEDIVQKIRTREILPGEKLVIKKLEEEYLVSSTPVRDALSQLKFYGFIEGKTSTTATVIRMSESEKQDLEDLNRELTRMSFRLITQNQMLYQVREKMRVLYQRQLELKEASDAERIAAYVAFVNVPGQNTGNIHYSSMTASLYGRSVVAFGDYKEVLEPDEVLENSRQMMEAMEEEDWGRFQELRFFMTDCFSRYLK